MRLRCTHLLRCLVTLLSLWTLVTQSACASTTRDAAWISGELQRRSGHALESSAGEDASPQLPPGVQLSDGLDEDEVAALALYRNPDFLLDMTRLRAARADLEEARRPDNPRISLQAPPLGVITGSVALLAPITSFFQLPQRSKAAARALESVAESLVQSGLNVVRDARIAHIDCMLAERRLEILQELSESADALAHLANARARVGDIAPADALVVQSQAAIAREAQGTAERELEGADARLRALLRYGDAQRALAWTQTRSLPSMAPPVGDLLRVARQTRPDARAAELELAGAAKRVGLERSKVLSLSLQSDVQWTARTLGARIGPSLEIPLFNQNQGGRGRAEAQVQAAVQRLAVVRERVTLEVISARAQLNQALGSHALYAQEILPPLQSAVEAVTQQYELGEASYLVVLDALSRLGVARLRSRELEAQARRAQAVLESSVGARLEVASTRRGSRT